MKQRKPINYGRIVEVGFSGARTETDDEAYQIAKEITERTDEIVHNKERARSAKLDSLLYGGIGTSLTIGGCNVAGARGSEGLKFTEQFNQLMHQGYFDGDFPYELAGLGVATIGIVATIGAIANYFKAKKLEKKINLQNPF